MRLMTFLLISLMLIGVACQNERGEDGDFRIVVEIDGITSTYTYNRPVDVGQFLTERNIDVEPADIVEPPQYTPITDGMTITITRVTEDVRCDTEPVDYDEHIFRRVDLPPGSVEIYQPGEVGEVQVCRRYVYHGDEVFSDNETSRTVLRDPVDQIVYVGVEDTLDPVRIEGTLVYISDGQAHIVQNNSRQRRPLTSETGLDGRVFEISADGRQLLYTRQTTDPGDLPFSNELWAVLDLDVNSESVRLSPINVLAAAWRPGTANTFYYTTANPAERGSSFQGWNAYNDLWIMRVDGRSGAQISVEPVLDNNLSGIYATWGTRFVWSPDGSQLAYAKADGIGLVDLENGEFETFLVSFPHYAPALDDDWVWQPTISWSADGEWMTLPVHGPPYGGEAPPDSGIFNVGVVRQDGSLYIDNLINQAGMWSGPRYSPVLTTNPATEYHIAYLQARDGLSSYGTQYDLVIADRDGSNPRRVFPAPDQPGIRPPTRLGEGDFVWSPSGRQIAIVYQGDLWLVEVATGRVQRTTIDEQISSPLWVP